MKAELTLLLRLGACLNGLAVLVVLAAVIVHGRAWPEALLALMGRGAS